MTTLYDDDFPPSKSQLKRDAHEIKELGEAMINLSKADLAKIPLPEDILDAIRVAQKIPKRGALKRQIQLIGKLLRQTEIEPIRLAYHRVVNHYQEDVEQHHALEKWRDRLLDEGDKALTELLNQYPAIDRQHIRQLVRSTQKEKQNNKPPKSSRELFRYLREIIQENKNLSD